MLDSAFPQPLQDWALRRLAFIQESITHETALFLFRLEHGGSAKIGLVSEDDHELGLFAARGMLGDPGSDFAQGGSLRRTARLADGTRRSNRANYSCHRSGEEKKTNDTPQRPDFEVTVFFHGIAMM